MSGAPAPSKKPALPTGLITRGNKGRVESRSRAGKAGVGWSIPAGTTDIAAVHGVFSRHSATGVPNTCQTGLGGLSPNLRPGCAQSWGYFTALAFTSARLGATSQPAGRDRPTAGTRCASHRLHRGGRRTSPPRRAALRSAAADPQPSGNPIRRRSSHRHCGLALRGSEPRTPDGELETAVVDVHSIRRVKPCGAVEGRRNAGEKSVQRCERALRRLDHVQPERCDGLNDGRDFAPALVAEGVDGAGDRWR